MRISNLSNKSGNPSSSDYLVLDDGTTVAKIDYNKLAKAIIENYAGSTVAGAAQSVKAALDSLNSKPIMASRILGGAYGGISFILVQDATAPYLRIDTPDGAYAYVRLAKY